MYPAQLVCENISVSCANSRMNDHSKLMFMHHSVVIIIYDDVAALEEIRQLVTDFDDNTTQRGRVVLWTLLLTGFNFDPSMDK